MNAFALDFDGVLCDSVHESGVTAWRAAGKIWPECQGAEPPDAVLSRYIRLRPLVETGYQTMLLIGLLNQGLSDTIIESQFPQLCEQLLRETGYSREYLARLFGQTRDAWIAQDLPDWLGRQRFYPKIIKRFAERVEQDTFFILTTKQERFVSTLLESRGIALPREHVLGLERGKSKEDILENLIQSPTLKIMTWHFVEDRLATLLRIAARDSLKRVRLYLADWGYNTAQDRDIARNNPAITVWNPEQFLMV